ncbi:MAG: tetratricopeptide repeat protein [Candidatus Wallbacteria bacterium]|nr:tetratricopeptide repeat protein [Candidatus Wallbacteria bacterium]
MKINFVALVVILFVFPAIFQHCFAGEKSTKEVVTKPLQKIPFDIENALKNGYSKSEIAKYLCQEEGLDYDKCLEYYTDGELIAALAQPTDLSSALKMFEPDVTAEEMASGTYQFKMGEKYAKGEGVPKDYKQAMIWYQKSADQGYSPAQNSLGYIYLEGFGTPQDYKQAMLWFQKAAEQGLSSAQYFLGIMYEKGFGVTQDIVEAHFWLNIAAASGHENARRERDVLAAKMTPKQVSEAQKMAAEWKPKK